MASTPSRCAQHLIYFPDPLVRLGEPCEKLPRHATRQLRALHVNKAGRGHDYKDSCAPYGRALESCEKRTDQCASLARLELAKCC